MDSIAPAMLEAERDQVAAAARSLAAEGLVTRSSGNVSARAGELVAITPTGARLEGLRGTEVVVVDLQGGCRDGPGAPSSELVLHLGVYRRYGAGAVVHTHAPVGTALACALDELPALHYAQLELGGTVRVAPYATFGTEELARLTLDALEGRRAVLMANHGTLAYGRTVDEALEHARLLEWCCELYWRAAAVALPRALSEAQLQEVARRIEELSYGAPAPPSE